MTLVHVSKAFHDNQRPRRAPRSCKNKSIENRGRVGQTVSEAGHENAKGFDLPVDLWKTSTSIPGLKRSAICQLVVVQELEETLEGAIRRRKAMKGQNSNWT